MTRDGLKAYLVQITQSDRWDPDILCLMLDAVSDEDILGLIKTPRICSNCKFYDKPLCRNAKCEDMNKLGQYIVSPTFGCNEFKKDKKCK